MLCRFKFPCLGSSLIFVVCLRLRWLNVFLRVDLVVGAILLLADRRFFAGLFLHGFLGCLGGNSFSWFSGRCLVPAVGRGPDFVQLGDSSVGGGGHLNPGVLVVSSLGCLMSVRLFFRGSALACWKSLNACCFLCSWVFAMISSLVVMARSRARWYPLLWTC